MSTATKRLLNSSIKMEICITVTPNSKKFEVIKIDDKNYRVRVDAPATGGRANKRLIEILSYFFDVPRGSVSIVRGSKGRKKIIKIDL